MNTSRASLAFLAFASMAWAQGSQLPKYTVATLPSAATVPTYTVQVIDGTTPSDCTAGGGGYNVLCVAHAGAWAPASQNAQYLPLIAGPSYPLTGELYGPSVAASTAITVGGVPTGNFVTIGPVSTPPASWQFNVSTPTTALNSIFSLTTTGTGGAATLTGTVLNIPQYAFSMVYPGAGIPNSTGSAWGTSYGTSGSGNVVLATGATITGASLAGTTTLPNSGSIGSAFFYYNMPAGDPFNVSNQTAATSGANQSSPLVQLAGTYWTGTAAAADTWSIQDVLGTGTNPTSTYTLSHTGTPGTASLSIPFSILVGAGTGITVGTTGATSDNVAITPTEITLQHNGLVNGLFGTGGNLDATQIVMGSDPGFFSAPRSYPGWHISSTLGALSTPYGPVVYLTQGGNLEALTVNVEGSLTCTTFPTIALFDCGTTVTGCASGGTSLASQATTGAGQFGTTGIVQAISAGHFIAAKITAMSCTVQPTMDISATIRER